MKYLVFLFWIPALIVLYLSIHQEVREARRVARRDNPQMTANSPASALESLLQWLRSPVRTSRSVDALFRQHQPLHRLSIHDMRLDDLVHIVRGHAPIPHRIGIDHDSGSVFTLVQTSRHVGTNSLLES